nr:TraR/DksA C4-type zinc finger protein [Streptomyces sp. HNM0574]
MERERAARQAQLRSLDDADTGAGAEAGFLTVQRTAAEDVLAEVEAALARLEQGNYGSCEGCAEAIPAERLEALPHARRCIGCQRRAG